MFTAKLPLYDHRSEVLLSVRFSCLPGIRGGMMKGKSCWPNRAPDFLAVLLQGPRIQFSGRSTVRVSSEVRILNRLKKLSLRSGRKVYNVKRPSSKKEISQIFTVNKNVASL